MLSVFLIFSLVVGSMTGFLGDGQMATASESDTITMTEVYNDGNYGVNIANRTVTISSVEELKLLNAYVAAGQGTKGYTFSQTQDITVSDYTFQYDESSERVGFYLDGKLLGAVDSQRCAYKNYESTEETTLKSLGITSQGQENWTPIGDFQGKYDGNGNAIKGLWCLNDDYTGLFGQISIYGGVCNVHLKNCLFIGGNYTGAIAGEISGYVSEEVKVANCSSESIVLGAQYCGGLVGISYVIGKALYKCCAKGLVIGDSEEGVGGCIGRLSDGSVSYCTFQGADSQVSNRKKFYYAGGIVGDVRNGEVANCRNYGKIVSIGGYAGGVVGNAGGGLTASEIQIYQCENNGEICGSFYSGGIIGSVNQYADDTVDIYRCINYGVITGGCGGGIAGTTSNATTIFDCVNQVTQISYENTVASGIKLGGLVANDYGTIQNCLNRADIVCVLGDELAGGFVGQKHKNNIQNSLSTGEILIESQQEDMSIGSAVGVMDEGNLKNCYYLSQDLPCIAKGEASITASYPVTGSQICGTSMEFISQEEGSFAYTASVIEALNRGVDMLNELKEEKEGEDCIYLQKWIMDEEGMPTISNVGVVDEEGIMPTEMPTEAPTEEPSEEPTATPTATPLPTEEPTVEPTVTPTVAPTTTPLPTAAPTVEPTVTPTIAPTTTPLPTVDPTVVPTVTPTVAPTVVPTTTPTLAPTATPTVEPTNIAVPSSAPTVAPTEEPSETPSEKPTITSSVAPTETLIASQDVVRSESPKATPQITGSPSPDIIASSEELSKEKVIILGVKVKSLRKVKITWQAVKSDSTYQIYRSKKKKTGYKLVQTINAKTSWTDKKLKKGKKYFYKICLCRENCLDGIQETFSDVKKVKMPWYIAPKVKYTKEKLSDGTKCLKVRLKKYKGTDIQIFTRKKDKSFQKLSLNYSKIKKYNGVFRLIYTQKKQKMYLKVRTYQKVKGKKRYSMYTPVKKVRL